MSCSQLDKVSAYIRAQPEHHKKMTFEQEFLALLKRAGISYDPKYVFGDLRLPPQIVLTVPAEVWAVSPNENQAKEAHCLPAKKRLPFFVVELIGVVMNRITILPLVFLFAATSVFAQQSVKLDNASSTVWTRPSTPGPDCPLGMQASHGAGVPVAIDAGPAINGAPIAPPLFVQQIHLTMTNLLPHEIMSARFVVHGYRDKSRALNLADSSQAPDLAKTVDLLLDVKGKGEASRDLSLRRFTAVTSIDLTSITYADGSAWHTPSPGACSVTPGLMRLVASTQ